MTEGIIPLWIDGEWNPLARADCHKCLTGQVHLFIWDSKEGEWLPLHDSKSFCTERSYES